MSLFLLKEFGTLDTIQGAEYESSTDRDFLSDNRWIHLVDEFWIS